MQKISYFYFIVAIACTSLIQSNDKIPYYQSGPRNVYAPPYFGITGGMKFKELFTQKGYNFYTLQELPDNLTDEWKQDVFLIIYANMPRVHLARQLYDILDRVIVLALEPPCIMPSNYNPKLLAYFKKVFIWDKNKVDNRKFFKLNNCEKQVCMVKDVVPFSEKKFCTFMSANKGSSHPDELYSKRREAIHFFEEYHPDDFEFYGVGWPAHIYKTYRGKVAANSIKDKIDVLKKYKFAICYENITNIKGYISEKIFHCLSAGCVPVYWGATDVTDYIPADCFIDKRLFPTLDDLYEFMKNITEEEYNQYLNSIRAFYASPEGQSYLFDNFVAALMDAFMAPAL